MKAQFVPLRCVVADMLQQQARKRISLDRAEQGYGKGAAMGHWEGKR
jgi:hypothetical protein